MLREPCVEVRSVDPVLLIEQVIDQAVDLDVIRDIVRRVQIDFRIAGEWLIEIGIVAVKELAARGDQIGAKRPARCELVVKSRFEPVPWHAGKTIARTLVAPSACAFARSASILAESKLDHIFDQPAVDG